MHRTDERLLFISPSRSFTASCFWSQKEHTHTHSILSSTQNKDYKNKQCHIVNNKLLVAHTGEYGWVCVCTFFDWLEFVAECFCVFVSICVCECVFAVPNVAVRSCRMINENCRTAAAAYTTQRSSVPVFSNGFYIVINKRRQPTIEQISNYNWVQFVIVCHTELSRVRCVFFLVEIRNSVHVKHISRKRKKQQQHRANCSVCECAERT